MDLIASYTAPSNQTSIQFTSISSAYTDLWLIASLRSSDNPFLYISFNGSTASLSNKQIDLNSGTTLQNLSRTDGFVGYGQIATSNTANAFSYVSIYIPNYRDALPKVFMADSSSDSVTADSFVGMCAGLWDSTAAITSINLSTGEVTLSSMYLYGIKNS